MLLRLLEMLDSKPPVKGEVPEGNFVGWHVALAVNMGDQVMLTLANGKERRAVLVVEVK